MIQQPLTNLLDQESWDAETSTMIQYQFKQMNITPSNLTFSDIGKYSRKHILKQNRIQYALALYASYANIKNFSFTLSKKGQIFTAEIAFDAKKITFAGSNKERVMAMAFFCWI